MDELIHSLKSLSAGQYAAVPYELFGDIFPPGIEDDRAKETAYSLAKGMGCVIENRPHEQTVCFVKEA